MVRRECDRQNYRTRSSNGIDEILTNNNAPKLCGGPGTMAAPSLWLKKRREDLKTTQNDLTKLQKQLEQASKEYERARYENALKNPTVSSPDSDRSAPLSGKTHEHCGPSIANRMYESHRKTSKELWSKISVLLQSLALDRDI